MKYSIADTDEQRGIAPTNSADKQDDEDTEENSEADDKPRKPSRLRPDAPSLRDTGVKYDPSQPRDEGGRWSDGGGTGGSAPDRGDGSGAQGTSPSDPDDFSSLTPAATKAASDASRMTGAKDVSIKVVRHLDTAFAKGEANLETGEIKVTKATAEDIARFQSGERDEMAIQGMHVVVHEAEHVAGPVAESARIMQVEAIEEATTEIAARQALAKEYGIKDKIIPNKTAHRFGTYQKVIHAGVAKMAETESISHDQAAKRFTEASEAWRARGRMTEFRPALDAFVSDLGFGKPDEDFERYRSGVAITDRMSAAYHGRL